MKLYAVKLLGLAASLTAPAFAGPVSEFELEDQNSSSIRFQERVAPANYRQQVSVWYFGAAT